MTSHYLFKKPYKRFLAQCFDVLGDVLVRPFLKKMEPADDSIQRILAIRLDHIGDAVMTRPALDALLDKFPDAQVDLLISAEIVPLFEDSSSRIRLIPVPTHWFSRHGSILEHYQDFLNIAANLRHEKYDLAVDFRGDFRHILLMTLAGIPRRLSFPITGGRFLLTSVGDYDPALHQMNLNLKLLEKVGVKSTRELRPFRYPEKIKASLYDQFSVLKGQDAVRIIIHMGAGYPSKMWPPERYRSLISELIKKNPLVRIILIGTKSEKSDMPMPEYPKQVFDLRGKISLEALPALMDLCHFYIGNDSGPAHIAAAQGIPGLIFFSGANRSTVWKPKSESLHILEFAVPCSPCEAKECPLKHHDCLENISLQQALDEVETFITQRKQTTL